ncbi:MAG: cytochrome c oxidase assembly protein, partial [Stappiaceae bacterium]
YGGTTQRAENSDVAPIDRLITVRFDANVGGNLPWDFKAKSRTITVPMGEVAEVAYFAKNIGSVTAGATATFNVTPFEAGPYFNKLECFCFTDQSLEAGEDMDMPVVFFVDPEMDKDPNLKAIREITLSYTFFSDEDENELTEKPVAAAAKIDGTPEKL